MSRAKGRGQGRRQRWRKKTLERFEAKIHIPRRGECWEWIGARGVYGHGTFWLDARMQLAYRVAYEHWVGPIPEGLTLDHLCRNPRCVRPDHLEPVTLAENIRRAWAARRTAAP